jgi:hypothetical protein
MAWSASFRRTIVCLLTAILVPSLRHPLSARSREQDPVACGEPRAAGLAAQHPKLIPQDQDLQVLSAVVSVGKTSNPVSKRTVNQNTKSSTDRMKHLLTARTWVSAPRRCGWRASCLVDPGDYAGCYAARVIAGDPGPSIAHHARGSAVDLNAGANPQGLRPHQDRRLVSIFERWGFTWGGRWLVPDGMHFELLRLVPNRAS